MSGEAKKNGTSSASLPSNSGVESESSSHSKKKSPETKGSQRDAKQEMKGVDDATNEADLGLGSLSDSPEPHAFQQQTQQFLQAGQSHPYFPQQQASSPGSPSQKPSGYDSQAAAFLRLQDPNNPFRNNIPYASSLPQLPLTTPQPAPAPSGENVPMGAGPSTSSTFPSFNQPPDGTKDPPSPSSYLHPPSGQTSTSPVPPSQGIYGTGMYGAGFGAGYGESRSAPSSPRQVPWSERNVQHLYQQPSPLVQQGMSQVHYPPHSVGVKGLGHNQRAGQFDEMPPPSAMMDNQDYMAQAAMSGASIGSGPTMFQQQWGYPPPDAYGQHQPHPGMMQGHHHGAQGQHLLMRPHKGPHHPPLPPYYHTSTTPGPPIQTTDSNKGPDGANLFIFHIPNHFTNMDMYNLFCHYGTLLSVRIMVEKDTGRSRGFGFVSYDSPESAALAIKELNGLVIGNKRLKVQHKQIRSTDLAGSGSSSHQQNTYRQSDRETRGSMGESPAWFNNQTSLTEKSRTLTESGKACAKTYSSDDSTNHHKSPEKSSSTDKTSQNEDTKVSSSQLPELIPEPREGDTDESALDRIGSLRSALPDLSK